MALGDEFINISQLGPRTSIAGTDIIHIRSTGGVDSKMTITSLFGSIPVNVGIGVASPEGELHVAGTAFPTLIVEATDTTDPRIRLTLDAATPNKDWVILLDNSSSDKLQFRYDSNILIDIETDGKTAIPGGLKTDNIFLKTKFIPIGDWDMEVTTALAGIAHGLTLSKIRGVYALIRNDGDNLSLSLIGNAPVIIGGQTGTLTVGTTNVFLERYVGGFFDSVNYNSVGYNRGYITIIYEA